MNFILKHLASLVCVIGFLAIACALVAAQFNQPQHQLVQPGALHPDQLQQPLLKQIQTEIRANDNEWKKIAPRVEKVLKLQRVALASATLPLGALRPEPPHPDREVRPGLPPVPPTTQSAETEALRKALDSLDMPDEAIAPALKTLREAHAQEQYDLQKARESLREVLILRQEARLVLMGILD